MVAFTAAAVDGPDYFSRQCELDGDLQAAIQWVSSRTQEEACPLFHAHNIVCSNANWQVNSVRLQTIAQIEKAGQQMWLSGAVDKWFGGSDSKVKQICKGVNGPLLQMLAEACNYHDMACLDLLRSGAQVAGDLCFSGNGTKLPPGNCARVDKLVSRRSKTNGSVVSKLREDPFSASLHKSCCDDAELGRMAFPRPLQLQDMLDYTLSPRFGVEQGFVASWLWAPAPFLWLLQICRRES